MKPSHSEHVFLQNTVELARQLQDTDRIHKEDPLRVYARCAEALAFVKEEAAANRVAIPLSVPKTNKLMELVRYTAYERSTKRFPIKLAYGPHTRTLVNIPRSPLYARGHHGAALYTLRKYRRGSGDQARMLSVTEALHWHFCLCTAVPFGNGNVLFAQMLLYYDFLLRKDCKEEQVHWDKIFPGRELNDKGVCNYAHAIQQYQRVLFSTGSLRLPKQLSDLDKQLPFKQIISCLHQDSKLETAFRPSAGSGKASSVILRAAK